METRILLIVGLSALLYTIGVESAGRCAEELESTPNTEGLPGAFRPQCTEKGHYQLIQRHGSTGYSWCVDPITGVKLDETQVGPGSEPKCPACSKLSAQALEKILIGAYRPQCDIRGNFKPVQISASTGLAWCVEPETGLKLTQPQRYYGSLECETRQKRAAAGQCAQELENSANTAGLPGAFRPACTEKGHYQLVQRHGSTGYSWCVNPTSGVKIEGTEVGPTGEEPQCPACSALLAQALEKILIGAYRPQCDQSGNFKPVQVSASTGMSWCADPQTGEKLTQPQRNDGTLKCGARGKRAADGPCTQELAASDNVPRPGAFRPQCTERGTYQLIQRHGSTGYSWCVNPSTGIKVEGTDVAPGAGTPACPTCLVTLARVTGGRLIGTYKPQCDAAGNFKPVQFSASTGMAWCADPSTGKKLTDAQRNDGTLKC